MITRHSVEAEYEVGLRDLNARLFSSQVTSEDFARRKKSLERKRRTQQRWGETPPGRGPRAVQILGVSTTLLGLASFLHSISASVTPNLSGETMLMVCGMALALGGTAWATRIHRSFLEYCHGDFQTHFALDRAPFDGDPIQRELTVACVHVKNFQALREGLSSLELLELLGVLRELLLDLSRQEKGAFTEGFDGCYRLFFGPPGFEDNSTGRGLRFSLNLLKVLKDRDFRLTEAKMPVRVGIGVHRGRSLVGSTGTENRGLLTVLGPVVDVAEELTAATGWDEILVSNAVADLSEDEFVFEPREPMFCQAYGNILRIFALIDRRPKEGSPGGR